MKAKEELTQNQNIVLIGMPTAGKTTTGLLLSKVLSCRFVDTDARIESREKRSLQRIIEEDGPDGFCDIEESEILSLECQDTVIATGGSVVYSSRAMSHLQNLGIVIYLAITLSSLNRRLTNVQDRGIVMGADKTLPGLFHERIRLYEEYAEMTICCNEMRPQEVADRILEVADIR